MACLSHSNFEGLIDGELTPAQRDEIMEHLRSCPACQEELRHMLRLHQALEAVVTADPCPSLATLDRYYQKLLSPQEVHRIEEHLELCASCKFYVQLLGASPAAIEAWQKQERLDYLAYETNRLGQKVADKLVGQLLPGKENLLTQIWEVLVDQLRHWRSDNWDKLGSLSSPGQAAGVLGFSETDPELAAVVVMAGTTLVIVQDILEQKLAGKTPEMVPVVRQISHKFGAGRELQERLAENLPPLLADLPL